MCCARDECRKCPRVDVGCEAKDLGTDGDATVYQPLVFVLPQVGRYDNEVRHDDRHSLEGRRDVSHTNHAEARIIEERHACTSGAIVEGDQHRRGDVHSGHGLRHWKASLHQPSPSRAAPFVFGGGSVAEMATTPSKKPVLLSYAGCSTCKKALRWLADHGVEVDVRPIVDAPPTAEELTAWLPRSNLPVRKWMNASGQSYRALSKEKVRLAKDADVLCWLTQDGKLVKRPVLVTPEHVLVGFAEAAYAELFA